MNNEINLLYNKKQRYPAQLQARIKALRYIAVGLLFAVAGISIVVFLLVLASPLPQLKEQESTLLNNLSLVHPKILQQVLIVSRLQDINVLLVKRARVDEQITLLTKDIPPELLVSSMHTDKELVSLTLNSPTLAAIDSYSNTLTALVEAKKVVKTVTLSSLTLTPGASYEVVYKIMLL